MKMDSLFERKIEHLLTVPHRLSFYIIMIIKNGSGIHSIDFKNIEYNYINSYEVEVASYIRNNVDENRILELKKLDLECLFAMTMETKFV